MIRALEEQIASLDNEIAQVTTDYVRLSQLMQEKEQAEEQLEQKLERFLELQEKLDQI